MKLFLGLISTILPVYHAVAATVDWQDVSSNERVCTKVNDGGNVCKTSVSGKDLFSLFTLFRTLFYLIWFLCHLNTTHTNRLQSNVPSLMWMECWGLALPKTTILPFFMCPAVNVELYRPLLRWKCAISIFPQTTGFSLGRVPTTFCLKHSKFYRILTVLNVWIQDSAVSWKLSSP
jgi:hypothetical protein